MSTSGFFFEDELEKKQQTKQTKKGKEMSETNNQAKTITISRNGVDKVLELTPFGKKSDNFGKSFWEPKVYAASWEDDSKWIGFDEILGMLNRNLHVIFMGIFTDNIDAVTGEFNMEAYLADCADFSAGVQKLEDINTELDELQGIQVGYVQDDNFGATNESGALTEAALALQTKLSELNKRIQPLRAQREIIKGRYAIRAQARKEKRAAQEAAEKAAAGSKTVDVSVAA